jgi:hypothetical protein
MQRKDKTLRSYIQRWSIIKNSAEDVSDERAVFAFLAGLRCSDLVEELGRTKPRTISELIEVANRFADGEDGYERREFQGRGSRGEEKPKYSGPSAEDMLHSPCRIHYMYLDGKRVSNHQMKDCRTFLKGCKVLWTRTKEHVREERVQVKDTKCSVSQNI